MSIQTHFEVCTLIAHQAVSMLDAVEREVPQCVREFCTARTITEMYGLDDLFPAALQPNAAKLADGPCPRCETQLTEQLYKVRQTIPTKLIRSKCTCQG